jgi:hypothetical protein
MRQTIGTVLCALGLLACLAVWVYALAHWPVPDDAR